jgi:hypothetical protein
MFMYNSIFWRSWCFEICSGCFKFNDSYAYEIYKQEFLSNIDEFEKIIEKTQLV